jgi:inhibitor of cysteine peptidase
MRERVGLGWSFVMVMLIGLVLVSGCGSVADAGHPEATPVGEVVLGAEDNGRQVALMPGQMLIIALESNPTTGYSWELAEGDAAVVQQVGEVEFSASAPEGEQLVGAGGTETFRFAAAEQGQTTLTLIYHRPWEKGVAPLETFSVDVVVR